MRVLVLGDDWYGSNVTSLADGFARAGHEVALVDSTPVSAPARLSVPWLYKRVRGVRAPWQVDRVHTELEQAVTAFRPELLLAFKSIHLDQDRLLGLPVPIKVHYSPDDVANPENITPAYLDQEHRWDCVVTTKVHNVAELRERGARDVLYVHSAYDPAWHHPRAPRGGRRYLAGFIGARRPDRRRLINDLATEFGELFYLAGPGGRRAPELQRSAATVTGGRFGGELSRAIAAVTANLVLLNSDNRDTHTCRTFEVPAAGGLFVGQRTDQHRELLTEGREALLFDDETELRDHLHRCRRDPEGVRRIAAAGHQRIVTGGHSYRHRAEEIVAHVG